MSAIVVIPTFNEILNLEQLIKMIRANTPDLHVLIVDDNSPDGTGSLADATARREPDKVFVIHRTKKEGLGKAYVAGLGYALERGYDIVAQMDGDLSHEPIYLKQFLSQIEKSDLVLGSRYMHGISVVNWDFKRLLLSKFATRYVQLITGMPFSDITSGFKCWRRETLEVIGLNRVFSNGYLFQIEMTFRAFRNGFRISEIPIVFFERDLGKSKMNFKIIIEAIIGVVRLRLSVPRRGKAKESSSGPVAAVPSVDASSAASMRQHLQRLPRRYTN
jgi:dolichol-phosphate mannosyltransferase